MGLDVDLLEQYIPSTVTGVFVEIGSDRMQGSTAKLDQMAQRFGTKLISVDILPHAQQRLQKQLPTVEFVVAAGSTWAKTFQGTIDCLFLDNYDYAKTSQEYQDTEWIFGQYQKHSNHESQLEHLRQVLALQSHMSPQGIIGCDDTYVDNGVWLGKCGPAVCWLLVNGWQVIDQQAYGVILRKQEEIATQS